MDVGRQRASAHPHLAANGRPTPDERLAFLASSGFVSERQAVASIQKTMAEWGSELATGYPAPPGPVPLLLQRPPGVPPMATMVCGGCGGQFAGNPHAVMVLANWPCCMTCWEKRAYLRARMGLPEQERPPCYPEDYQTEERPAS
jgi:hypothetical protein